jgi:glycine/D-amino acid oxidase-like deaminating enzyme
MYTALDAGGGFEYEWKGLICNTKDGLPLAGPVPGGGGRLQLCAGFNGHGMPRCFGLARALLQQLEGDDSVHPVDGAYLRACRVDRFQSP